MEVHDRWASEKKSMFILSLRPSPIPDPDQTSHSVRLREERVKALWEGLRRKYFGETEAEAMLEEGHPPGNHPSLQEERLQEQNLVLRQQIADLMDSLRRRGVRIPIDPPSPTFGFRDNDPGDPPPGELVMSLHDLFLLRRAILQDFQLEFPNVSRQEERPHPRARRNCHPNECRAGSSSKRRVRRNAGKRLQLHAVLFVTDISTSLILLCLYSLVKFRHPIRFF